MKFIIVFVAVVAVASAQLGNYRQPAFPFPSPSPVPLPRPTGVPVVNRVANSDQTANIIRYDNDISPDGSYNYAYETDNGIAVAAQGVPRDFGGNPPLIPIVSTGSYSYTSPEGKPIFITYIADENGFQPSGDALPTPHPIPEAILRSLEYNAKNAPPQKK